jgi:hypothetical protein
MRSKIILALIGIVIMMALPACGGAASAPEPTVGAATAGAAEASAVPSEPVATPQPTEEPTLESTAESPTASPEPTAEPTAKPTKEPPPEVSPETFVGLFTQYDFEAGGNNWLLFNEDGTFVGRHGPTFETGVAVTEGTYTLEGNVLTLIMPEECPDGEVYELRFSTTEQLHFEVVETSCNAFADDFRRQPNWERAES